MSENRTAYDYGRLARRVVDALVDSEGEETDEVVDLLELLEGAPSKLVALRYVDERLKGEIAILLEHRNRIDSRREARKRDRDRIRETATELLVALREAGQLENTKIDEATGEEYGGKVVAPEASIWLQRSPKSVDGPEDLALWPDRWIREYVDRKPDRRKALAELEENPDAGGATFRVVQREGVRWR